MAETIELQEILTRMLENEYDLKIIAHDAENNEITLFSGAPLYEFFATKFGEYQFRYSGIFGAVESFRISFENYKIRNQNNIDRRYQALTADYNPINNYDMTENETHTTTNENAKTNTVDGTKTQTGTITDAATTNATNKVYGWNSGSGVNSDETSGATNNTKTHNLSYGDDTITTDHETGETVTERELTRSGNIGVTTSAQMIAGELEIRVHDLAAEILYEFAHEYLYCVGVVSYE